MWITTCLNTITLLQFASVEFSWVKKVLNEMTRTYTTQVKLLVPFNFPFCFGLVGFLFLAPTIKNWERRVFIFTSFSYCFFLNWLTHLMVANSMFVQVFLFVSPFSFACDSLQAKANVKNCKGSAVLLDFFGYFLQFN